MATGVLLWLARVRYSRLVRRLDSIITRALLAPIPLWCACINTVFASPSPFLFRALALAPLAGWLSKEQYGDANALLRMDVAVSQIDPGMASVLAATVRENDVDAAASNVVGLPVLMRIGAQDATVHPYYSRRLHRVLHQLHADVQRGPSRWPAPSPLAADVGVVELPGCVALCVLAPRGCTHALHARRQDADALAPVWRVGCTQQAALVVGHGRGQRWRCGQ